MTLTSIIFIAFAMATDAFAAAVAKGAALHKPSWKEALRTGLIFGVIETLTPLVGWAIGSAAVSHLEEWDHWIAFVLLGGLGLHMIIAGFGAPEVPEERPQRHNFLTLAVTGFATSIDAMAVGVGLAFVKVDILTTALAIGLATFTMVSIGVMVGRVLGAVVGKRAEVFGGLILIVIGSVILYEHLTGAA